jgi:CDP-6-deoxy-D-xylo-4-hexulose-3-dehydrase
MKWETWYPLSIPTIGDEEVDAAVEVLQSRQTTMGYRVEQFEQAFAKRVGARHAVMVNSGSSADLLMAYATKGDHIYPQVLISAVTWPTHVWSFIQAGYRVKFTDVDGLNTTTELVEAARSPVSSHVSVVHLMGIPAVVDTDLEVTEDCCEALGADPVGEHTASWSFFFSHHMTTMEGGMITTDDPNLRGRLKSMRSHGWARGQFGAPDPRYSFIEMGFNVRPLEISAAIGLVQLKRLDGFNELREKNRQIFADRLEGCPGVELPKIPDGVTPSWFGLPFFADNRDALRRHLESHGVETRPILGGNLLRQPAFKDWHPQKLPGADRVHDHGLYVGLHPVSDSGVDRVAELIGEFCG